MLQNPTCHLQQLQQLISNHGSEKKKTAKKKNRTHLNAKWHARWCFNPFWLKNNLVNMSVSSLFFLGVKTLTNIFQKQTPKPMLPNSGGDLTLANPQTATKRRAIVTSDLWQCEGGKSFQLPGGDFCTEFTGFLPKFLAWTRYLWQKFLAKIKHLVGGSTPPGDVCWFFFLQHPHVVNFENLSNRGA